MKRELILSTIWMISMIASHATPEEAKEHLKHKLADAYTTNNQLIHRNTPQSANRSIELLTKNYIEQLRFVKFLADDKVEREVLREKVNFMTDRNILHSHILDLYEEQYEARKKNVPAYKSTEHAIFNEQNTTDWDQAHFLIRKIISTKNSLFNNPSAIEDIKPLIPTKISNAWYFSALSSNKTIISKNHEILIKGIKSLEYPQSSSCRSYYAIGVSGKNGSYMAKFTLKKGENGLFVADIVESNDERLAKRVLQYIESVSQDDNKKALYCKI